MMVSTVAPSSPHLLGIFMLALACVPLVFVWLDHRRRSREKTRMGQLRREARIMAQLGGRDRRTPSNLVSGWAGGARN